jgi:hypothetical protein
MLDAEICTTPYKLCPFELSPIICEDLPGHAEPVYDTLEEIECYFLCDIHYWYYLHPLGEGVNGNI